MREIVLSVDWGQTWPLSDVMWFEEDRPDWQTLISPDLTDRLLAWAKYFNTHADLDSGTFGGEDYRKWFDLEGVALLNELHAAAGAHYRFKLELWF